MVSFYTTDLNCNYVINIYNNTGSQPISQAGPVLTQGRTISTSGYNTVSLNSGVELKASQNFSVVLKLTNPNYQYPIAMETPIPNYCSQATANVSESCVSSDGKKWTDITTIYPNTDVCIKAFTNPQAMTPKQTPTITWSNPANITYGTALSNIQLDASASVPGPFVYTPPAGTVLNVGSHQKLNTTFMPNDIVNYTTAPAAVSINVLEPVVAYITNSGDRTVSVINTTNNSIVATVPVGSYPIGVAVTSNGTKVYVANYVNSGTVSVINTTTNNITATVPVGNYPEGVAVTPDGSKVYVTNHNSNTVSVINTITNTVTATVPVGRYPIGVAVTPDESKVYVTNQNGNDVSVINTTTNTVTATLPVGTYPVAFEKFIT